MTIGINNLLVNIVTSRDLLPEECKNRNYPSYLEINGDNKTLTIWILGEKKDNKLVLNEFFLGHELMHILNLFTGSGSYQVIDPDKLLEER